MGCDIHGWIEIKVAGKYIATKELSGAGADRNYPRFSALDSYIPILDNGCRLVYWFDN